MVFIFCHCERPKALLHGSVSRHCEKNYAVIRRSNPVKNSDLQNFFNYFSGLSRRFAPRNDDSGIHATTQQPKALLHGLKNALDVIPTEAGMT
ncbi:hypothetical protein [Rickettsia hoogstraalii]|uniref:hypothetical protein n=1 Tax=Rickettsia hoogstraalii TaxID=467174 RepID=UPI001E35B9E1|nr:hypothetical protein [Rickettsia hoogstraalii]